MYKCCRFDLPIRSCLALDDDMAPVDKISKEQEFGKAHEFKATTFRKLQKMLKCLNSFRNCVMLHFKMLIMELDK